MLRCVDLFAGCGGLSLGFEKAGFEVAAAFDNWQPAVSIYEVASAFDNWASAVSIYIAQKRVATTIHYPLSTV